MSSGSEPRVKIYPARIGGVPGNIDPKGHIPRQYVSTTPCHGGVAAIYSSLGVKTKDPYILGIVFSDCPAGELLSNPDGNIPTILCQNAVKFIKANGIPTREIASVCPTPFYISLRVQLENPPTTVHHIVALLTVSYQKVTTVRSIHQVVGRIVVTILLGSVAFVPKKVALSIQSDHHDTGVFIANSKTLAMV